MTQESMNLFWKQKEKPSIDYSEKENNVTHAFLVTAKNEPIFLKAVLQKAGIKTKIKTSYDVYFQVSKKRRYQTLDAKNKYLLFISSKYNTAGSDTDEERGTIPDGLIIDDNASVLIESKVTSRKDSGQLRRYNTIFYKGKGELKEIYWEDIFDITQKFLKKCKSSLGEYLVSQFREYLEVVNMAGFDGIPFFRKEEVYDKEIASKILNRLGSELKPWLAKKGFVLAGRPKAVLAWDYFYDKKIKSPNPGNIPHYSILIFPEFYAVETLFHRQELRKILKDKKLKEEFFDGLEKLSKYSPDYFLQYTHYRLLANKRKANHAQTGDGYSTLNFILQISRFIKQNKKDWRIKLSQILELLIKQECKQISILKKAFYKDKEYIRLDDRENSINFIKNTVERTKHLNDMILKIYFEKF